MFSKTSAIIETKKFRCGKQASRTGIKQFQFSYFLFMPQLSRSF